MASTIVIKVKYGDTLRRFKVNLNEGGKLDLDIEGMRAKIRSLFNFPSDVELTLTYLDEDQDVVALIDDNDVCDMVRQALNPVRINVQPNMGKTDIPSSHSSACRSPFHNLSPKTSSSVADLLKSVPDPFREPLTMLSVEMASMAASSAPGLGDLIETFTKMGQAVLNSQCSCQPTLTESTACKELSGSDLESSGKRSVALKDMQVKVDGFVLSSDYTKQTQLGKGTSISSLQNKQASRCAMPNENSAGNCASGNEKMKSIPRIETSGVVAVYSPEDDPSRKGAAAGSSSIRTKNAKSTDVCTDPPHLNSMKKFNPFAMPYVPPPSLFNRANYFGGSFDPAADNSRAQAAVFHSGVCCDECGIIPITGPRYKSKVKYNYDLCQICFEQKGKDSDYQRIDLPVLHTHPWSLGAYSGGRGAQWVSDQLSANPTAAATRCMRNLLRPRLESRFILDVNIADGTIMAPKTPFTKIWRMRNCGTLPWPRGIQLVWIGGDKFSDTEAVDVEIPSTGLEVEEELDVAVDFVAPEFAGRHISYWRMASPSGQKFGQRVWVLIQVDPSLNCATLDIRQTHVVDLNSLPEYTNQNPQQNQIGHSDVPLVDMACDVDNNNSPLMIRGQQGNSPGSNDPVQWMHDPLLDLSGTQHCLLGLQPHSQTTTSQPSLSPSDISKVSYPTVETDVVRAAHTPTNTNNVFPNLVSIPNTPTNTNNVFPNLVSVPTTAPFASSSTAPSYPKKNGTYVLTDASDLTSQAGNGVANDGSFTTDQDNVTINDIDEVEKALVNELVEMGFTELHLNKEVLRKNSYCLEKSLDQLCGGAADWILHLEELHGMGFYDDEMNRKVLVKNNGSLKHAVMDLISRENA